MYDQKNSPLDKDSPRMTTLSLRVTEATKDKLMALAAADERSINWLVNKLIEKELAEAAPLQEAA